MNNEIIKDNLIKLAIEHKKRCCDEYCTISLHLLEELLIKAGIEVTKEDRLNFI